jgi:hypothetical protein
MKKEIVKIHGDPEGAKKIQEYLDALNRGEGRPVPDSMLKRMEDPIGFDHTGRPFTDEDTERNYRRMFGPKNEDSK